MENEKEIISSRCVKIELPKSQIELFRKIQQELGFSDKDTIKLFIKEGINKYAKKYFTSAKRNN